MKLDIVLVEPGVPGNIGAVARCMKNFGFKNLVLVDPACDHLDVEARNRAKHANNVLRKARVVSWGDLEYDYLVATTGNVGGDYNLLRSPVRPVELAERLGKVKGKRFALIFGRENDGLHNDEIARCDFAVSIPTHPRYPAMNLSHAVAVVLYELSKAFGKEKIGKEISPVGAKDKDNLVELIDAVLDKVHFQTEKKRETQRVLWRRVIGKAMLTKREAMTLMGFFRRVKK